MTVMNDPNWSPFDTASPDDGANGKASAPAAAGDRDGHGADRGNDGAGHGTTHHTSSNDHRAVNGGPNGHTVDETGPEPHSAPESVVGDPDECGSPESDAQEGSEAPERAPRRPFREVLADWYGDPRDAFRQAQPSIAECMAYSDKARWTLRDGKARKFGVVYNRAIGNPGVVVGYQIAYAFCRPAHLISTGALACGWHFSMQAMEWNLTAGWTGTLVAYWIANAVAAAKFGKQGAELFGARSEGIDTMPFGPPEDELDSDLSGTDAD